MKGILVEKLVRGGPVQNFYLGSGILPTVDRGEGIYLFDTEGKKYLDASSGPVTCNLGHHNMAVLKAINEQAQKVCFASYNFFENAPNKRLAKKLVEFSGQHFDQAFFVSGGSEAIEASIKLSRQYAISIGETKRYKVLARTPSYHGSTMGAFALSGDPQMEDLFKEMAAIITKVPVPFSYRIPEYHSIETYADYCANELERAILDEGSETVLAFIIEPVGGLSTGALVAPEFYYSKIREICSKYGVLLIYDEVMSGAGRTGEFLASHHWPKSSPDLTVLAKGLCAGYSPLGAVIAPNRIVGKVLESGGFMHGHTYASNPLSCAIAYSVLSELMERDLISNSKYVGSYLKHGLRKLANNTHVVGDVRGEGLLLAIEIVSDKKNKKIFDDSIQAIYKLAEIGRENGILIYARKTAKGAFGEWLMITPPLTCTIEEADLLLELLSKTIRIFEDELGFIKMS